MQFSQKYFNVICHKCRDGRGNEKRGRKLERKEEEEDLMETNRASRILLHHALGGERETIFPSNLRLTLRLRDPHYYVIADVIYKCGTKL